MEAMKSSSPILEKLSVDRLQTGFDSHIGKVAPEDRTGLFAAYVGQVMLAKDVIRRGPDVLSDNDSPAIVIGNAAALLEQYGCPEHAQQMINEISKLDAGIPEFGFHVRKIEGESHQIPSWIPSLKDLRANFTTRIEKDFPKGSKGKGKKISARELTDLWTDFVSKLCFAVDVMRRGDAATTPDAPPAVVLGQAAALLKRFNFKDAAETMMQKVSELTTAPTSVKFSEDAGLIGIDTEWIKPTDTFGETIKGRRKSDTPERKH